MAHHHAIEEQERKLELDDERRKTYTQRATSEDQSILSFYPPHTAMLQQLNEVFSLDMAEHEKILAQEWKEFCDKVNLKRMLSRFSP